MLPVSDNISGVPGGLQCLHHTGDPATNVESVYTGGQAGGGQDGIILILLK